MDNGFGVENICHSMANEKCSVVLRTHIVIQKVTNFPTRFHTMTKGCSERISIVVVPYGSS